MRATTLTTKTATLLAALLTLAFAAVAAGCGDDDEGTAAQSTPAGNAIDRGFVADMVPHHRSAVQMAAIATDEATSKFVKDLAATITRTQNAEIAQMQRIDAQLAEAGIEQGDLGVEEHMMGMDGSMGELRGAKPFDDKFLEMMIPHHEGAIPMARAELAKGKNAELKKLARTIIAAQQREIREMRAHLGDAKAGGGAGDQESGGGGHGGHSG